MEILDARFATYLAVAALLIVTPGPDMALVTRNALSAGRRAASFTAFGVGLGILGWAVAAALGVGTLLERSVVAFTVLKLAGAAYLCFLGWRNLRGQHGAEAISAEGPGHASHLGPGAAFRQGAFGNLLNPKAGVIFVSILPQFVRPGDSPLRLILMLIAFECLIVCWLNVYGALISRAGQSRAGQRVRQILERATGAVLIALGLRLAVERR